MANVWDKAKAVKHLNDNARGQSVGQCAKYTRQAIEAGGLTLTRTHSAKDYGTSLTLAGFVKLNYCPAMYVSGDVVIIAGFAGALDGHMAMYNGTSWVSDFVQRDIYPGPGYRKEKPAFVIYRQP